MAKTEYVDVILTDIQLHRQKPTNPKPMAEVFHKASLNGKPGRAYGTDVKANPDGTFTMALPLYGKLKKAAESGKQLRFHMPKDGLPIYLGQDALEFIAAQQCRQTKPKSKHLTK